MTLRSSAITLPRRLVIAALFAVITVGGALAQGDPVAFAQKMGDTAIAGLTDPKLNDSERVKRMRALLRKAFDLEAVSRSVLGAPGRQASPAQFKEFVRLYEIYVAHNYAGLFKRYNGEKVEMRSAQKQPDGESVVSGVILQPEGPPINLELRVKPAGDSYKGVDLRVEGISMPLTHRKQFASVINQRGGVDGLLAALRDATKKFEAKAPSE